MNPNQDGNEQGASDTRFRALVEGAPDGIVISRQGVVVYANPAALRLLGYDDSSELVGQMMSIFLDGAALGTMRRRLERMRETGEVLPPYEYPAKRRDGTSITAEIASIFLEYEGSPAVLAYARDVTERSRLRAQLAHADRLAALGKMAAGVAHEINNPLAMVSLSAERLEAALASPESSRVDPRALAADIRLGVQRIGAIARDLKLFGRFDDEPVGPVALGDALDAAARIVAHEISARATLRREHGPLPSVLGVPMRIEQVFVNLLLNAAFAIDETAPSGEIVVSAKVDGSMIEIAVTDNGAGMPKELVDRIFEPFFTTRAAGAGTGLGLSICRDIINSAGGEITAESEVGRGTTMRVRLAIVESAKLPSVAPIEVAPKTKERRRALVIDDESSLVSILVDSFEDDHDIVGETNPHAAVERLLSDPSFDVIFCDMMMPGLSGMEVFERIARDRPGYERRFVFVTGGTFTSRATKFLNDIPNGRLMKPFELAEFAKWLAGSAESSAGGSAASR